TVGAVAALSVAAVGSTFVIGAGEPSPATIRSPVLPGGMIAKGAPLPRQTAVVVGATQGATVSLTCPPGQRVADLLPPDAGGVTPVYDPSTHPGLSRTATIALSGTHGRNVGVAILCRVPGPDGSLTPTSATASAASAQPPAVVCVERDYLRAKP